VGAGVVLRLDTNHVRIRLSGSEAGSYLRLIDFVYYSTLGLRVIKGVRGGTRLCRCASLLPLPGCCQRDFFIDNLLVRIHFIIVMIRWTGLAPWDLKSLFQVALHLPS